jgi:hypothetical protein
LCHRKHGKPVWTIRPIRWDEGFQGAKTQALHKHSIIVVIVIVIIVVMVIIIIVIIIIIIIVVVIVMVIAPSSCSS